MSNVPGVIPSAAAGVPLTPANRTRLEYSTVAKTGSDKKIGCGWSQFSGDIDADIEYVSLFIGDIYASIQHDAVAKTTYFIFYKVEQAIQFMKTPIFVDERRVELYQTIKLEEGAQIISISSNKNLSTPTYSPYGTIIDFSAFKNKITSLFHTYGIKFLFKKNTEEFKIPEFIDIENEKIALTYRGCVPACSYCKKIGHWRTKCPEVKKQRQCPKYYRQKKWKKKLAQKSLNEFQNFKNFIESPTNDRTGDRTNDRIQDGTNRLGKTGSVPRLNPWSSDQVQGTKAIIINSNCDQHKIIPKGLDLAGNKLTKEFNRVPYNEITLEASEIDFGTDYSCLPSPPVVEIMNSNDGTVDNSKVRADINYNSIRKMVKIHTKICPDSIKISKKRQQNGESRLIFSPKLFGMYKNVIFDVVDGVHVSGLGKWIPGLLFADDAIVIAESSDKLQIALNVITK
ncbi:hypothetical protein BB561_001609 [Smittium simulii]|uniref:CCHC-type domain-containing protein n=1 Tax=Smittium simulii TaxID=133385 RepID=A0A2T9YTY5_9FUNG|nr:hypothetical protein BB561_001609 [Smittium simulii]